jgi:hypothetical protein
MPRVRFDLMIPVFERAKTIHALDCAATVIGGVCPSVKCIEISGKLKIMSQYFRK